MDGQDYQPRLHSAVCFPSPAIQRDSGNNPVISGTLSRSSVRATGTFGEKCNFQSSRGRGDTGVLLPLFPGPEKDGRSETDPRLVSVQQVDHGEAVSHAHDQTGVGVCSPGRLVHLHRSEGRVFPRADRFKAQEISALLIPGDTVPVQPPAVRLLPGSTHFLKVCGNGAGAVAQDRDESAILPGRSAIISTLQGRTCFTDKNTGVSSVESGLHDKLEEKLRSPRPVRDVSGGGIRFRQHESTALTAENRSVDSSSPPRHASQCCDSSLCHAPAGHDVSRTRGSAPGPVTHETSAEMVHSSARRSGASAKTHGCRSSLSERRSSSLEESPHAVSGSSAGQSCITHFSVHRRISLGMGGNVSVTSGGRTVASPHVSPHQRAGAPHGLESTPAFCFTAAGSTHPDPHRQQGHGSLHKSPRRSALRAAAEHSEAAAAVDAHTLSVSQSSVYSRCFEHGSGHHVEGRSSTRRLVPSSRSGESDLEQVRRCRGGYVRLSRKRTVRSVVFSERAGQSSAGSGRVSASAVAQDASLRFSTGSFDSTVPGSSTGGAAVSHPHSTGAHGRVMVSMSATTDLRVAMGDPVARGRSLSGRRSDQELPDDRSASVGLAAEREHLERLGLSQDVVRTIQGARAASTRASYTSKWSAFQRWCVDRSLDPTVCPLPQVLSFLQLLMDRNLAFSTVKTYAAAISSCHEGFGGRTVFSHPLTKRFLRGVRRDRPVSRSLAPQWDLALVLRALVKAPFEPLEQIPLKLLSVKTALLLALTSAKRVSDLSALSVAPSCLRIQGDCSSAILRPNPAFTPKIITSSFRSRVITLEGFFPPPHDSEEEATSHLLCPVRALACYVARTAVVRRTQRLFVHYGEQSQGLPLSAQRLSHWLCDAVSQAYLSSGMDPPQSIRAHSTRGISASAALHGGMTVGDICTAASWSSPCSFIRFYLRDVSRSSMTHSVLSVLSE